MINVLFVGESWMFETTEYKGVDKFTISGYQTATEWIEKAFNYEGFSFTHIPCHEVDTKFPVTLEELQKYDVVMFSDVGSNTFLLGSETFYAGKICVNKLELVKEYVEKGGAFAMIGGYLTFQGIEGRGRYHNTPIEEILPVEILPYDDRVELPQGYQIRVENGSHSVLNGIPSVWPPILGYNKLKAKEHANVIAHRGEDALVTLGSYGEGRTLAYATDCSPHWSSPEFCEWEYYGALWRNLSTWLAKKEQ